MGLSLAHSHLSFGYCHLSLRIGYHIYRHPTRQFLTILEEVHPYLAMETLAEMAKGLSGDLAPEKAVKNFIKAVDKGLQKVMSKMGISTYMSYTGSQIFEAIGLNHDIIDQYFTTSSYCKFKRGCKCPIGIF